MKSREVLHFLSEILIQYLDELTKQRNVSDFVEGEIYAYIECLEIISHWRQFKKYGIVNIEEKYPLNI